MLALRRHAKAIAFIVLAVALVIVLHWEAQSSAHSAARNAANQIVASQRASCRAGNDLRRQLNLNIQNADAQRHVVISFLENASTARMANYTSSHLPADLTAAKQYAAEGEILENERRNILVPIRACAKVYPKQ